MLSSTDVGASLGADSVKRSIAAGLVGLVIVVIFMISYYRLPGLLASLALLGYAGIVLAIFKTVPVTLTLAGLAGFILSVGMAVDANVLIFERFKEEMRAGRTVGAAVDAAVRRAWPAIRDSNASTAITCVVLLFAAPTQIKGFALTLLIGVVDQPDLLDHRHPQPARDRPELRRRLPQPTGAGSDPSLSSRRESRSPRERRWRPRGGRPSRPGPATAGPADHAASTSSAPGTGSSWSR